jgi:sRNA-binding carbon storage regulator CsrA
MAVGGVGIHTKRSSTILVLSRRDAERIRLTIPHPAGEIVVWLAVLASERGRCSLGISAPEEVVIERAEVIGRKTKA